MSSEDIIGIIDAIPQYIKYLYPGYITIYVYTFFRAKHISDSTSVVIKALALSYVYSVIIDRMCLPSELYVNLMLILLAVGVAYMAYLVTKSEYTLHILQELDIETSFYDNEIEALQNVETGTWLVLYLNNDDVVYEGWLHHKELEEGCRKYLVLSSYRKFLLDENGKPVNPYIEDNDNNKGEEVIIFYDDIKRIEKRDTSK